MPWFSTVILTSSRFLVSLFKLKNTKSWDGWRIKLPSRMKSWCHKLRLLKCKEQTFPLSPETPYSCWTRLCSGVHAQHWQGLYHWFSILTSTRRFCVIALGAAWTLAFCKTPQELWCETRTENVWFIWWGRSRLRTYHKRLVTSSASPHLTFQWFQTYKDIGKAPWQGLLQPPQFFPSHTLLL